MEQQPQQQQRQQDMQTPIQLTLTLGQINTILQAMHKAPYEMAKPMIDLVTEQAQKHVNQMNTQRQPAQDTALQQGQSIQMPNMMPQTPTH